MTLELIDFSFEDDSLLPTTVSPPEDKPVASVLRLPPSVKNVKKAPGDRHISGLFQDLQQWCSREGLWLF